MIWRIRMPHPVAALTGLLGGLSVVAATWAASPPLQATIFAPDIISGSDSDFAPGFMPNARQVVFTRNTGDRFTLLQSSRHGESWSAPVVMSFSGRWHDLEAAVSPDGVFVVFASDRPAAPGMATLGSTYAGKSVSGGNLWRSDFRSGRWGEPVRLPDAINSQASVWTPSIAASGALYFMSADMQTGRFRLHRATTTLPPTARVHDLAFSTGQFNDVDPATDAAERFLLFSSDRAAPRTGGRPGPERLFIAFRPRGAPLVCPLTIAGWEDPALSQVEARLSPDGRTLYFASRRLAHRPGEPPRGAWDNGKANIWQIPFTDRLWRAAAADDACRSQPLPGAGASGFPPPAPS
jgi:hypothetical protein